MAQGETARKPAQYQVIRVKCHVNQWFDMMSVPTSRSMDAYLSLPFLMGAVLSAVFLGFHFAPVLFWLFALVTFLLCLSGLRSERRSARICAVTSLVVLLLLFVISFVPILR
jgi:hypothetical protein